MLPHIHTAHHRPQDLVLEDHQDRTQLQSCTIIICTSSNSSIRHHPICSNSSTTADLHHHRPEEHLSMRPVSRRSTLTCRRLIHIRRMVATTPIPTWIHIAMASRCQVESLHNNNSHILNSNPRSNRGPVAHLIVRPSSATYPVSLRRDPRQR